ncbi:SPOR domain-containing protein [Mesonia sp. K4-1]|uniref:HU domain-containing protein n=1 Tax=Mesonia sp. K4-1 TaxID=2602760 RepID=UPI0021056AC0|nr:SPOR domain-containing protein [Mesonia sp. K4-1]
MEHYIKELLYRYECVVIPGFGGFLTQRKSAYLDIQNQQFIAPSKSISFNRQLIENDGILANYIAKAENISYQQAVDKINLFVEQLSSSLAKHKEIKLPEIGTFYQKDDKILFFVNDSQNFLLDSFGLQSTKANSVKEKASKILPQQEEITTAPIKEISLQEAIVKRSTSSYAFAKYAAVGVIALGVAGLFGANWYSQNVTEHNLVEQQKATKKVEQQIQEATFVINNPLPEIVFKVKTEIGNYHIVAGAFREKENAAKKVTQLKAEGFSPREIGANKYGLHQVVYGSFETREEALAKLREIKKSNNPGAWLLVKEL